MSENFDKLPLQKQESLLKLGGTKEQFEKILDYVISPESRESHVEVIKTSGVFDKLPLQAQKSLLELGGTKQQFEKILDYVISPESRESQPLNNLSLPPRGKTGFIKSI